jgi:hypothetical protein
MRGQYRVGPLLARWILERAVRHQDHHQPTTVADAAPVKGAT